MATIYKEINVAGTKDGAAKAAATIKAKNPNFYKEIGSIGGKASSNGGFASKKVGIDGLTGAERASRVGAIGGRVSRRKPRAVEPVEPPKKSIWERLKGSA